MFSICNFVSARRWLGTTLLACAVTLAACGPPDEGQPPDGTDAGPIPTLPPTLGPVATGIGTEAPLVTPSLQPAPVADGPLVVSASRLVGTEIVDSSGEPVGEIADVLIEPGGEVRYVAVDTGLEADAGFTAIAWAMLQPHPPEVPGSSATGEPALADDTLIFRGTLAQIEQAPLWTPEASPPAIFRTESSEWPAELNDLLRLGGILTDFNLLNSAGEDLGEVEDVLLDLGAGQALYGVADFGGFLGLAERPVAVPWEHFSLQDGGGAGPPQLRLNLEAATIASAPVFEPETLPAFLAPANEDWDADTRDFWNEVGIRPGPAVVGASGAR